MIKSQTEAAFLLAHQERSFISLKCCKSIKQLVQVLNSFLNTGVALGIPSEGVNKIEICIEEAGGIFQLRVVTDVFVQNGDCGPLDQLPAGTRYMF